MKRKTKDQALFSVARGLYQAMPYLANVIPIDLSKDLMRNLEALGTAIRAERRKGREGR